QTIETYDLPTLEGSVEAPDVGEIPLDRRQNLLLLVHPHLHERIAIIGREDLVDNQGVNPHTEEANRREGSTGLREADPIGGHDEAGAHILAVSEPGAEPLDVVEPVSNFFDRRLVRHWEIEAL